MVCVNTLLPTAVLAATGPEERGFFKPGFGWKGPQVVYQTVTETETVTAACTASTVTLPPLPQQTIFQTVLVSHHPQTFMETVFHPVYITNTEVETITQLKATAVYEPTTVYEVQTGCCTPSTVTVTVDSSPSPAKCTTSSSSSCSPPTSTPSSLPCPPPPYYCVYCNDPHCPNTCDSTPLPVRVHKKLLSKARQFLNSDAVEMTGESWKTPGEVCGQCVKPAPPRPYKYKYPPPPCACPPPPSKPVLDTKKKA